MLAVDTNVIVRLLTRDDPAQWNRTMALFRSQEIWVAKTVLLEAEWVLRSGYGFTVERVTAAFRRIAGLPNVRLEDSTAVESALEWHAQGLDFADALNLASRGPAGEFGTFDEKFVKHARRAGVETIRLL